MINRLKDNNIHFMSQGKNDQGQDCLYVYGKTERQDELVIGEIAINGNQVMLQTRSRQEYLIPLFQQSLSFIISANI